MLLLGSVRLLSAEVTPDSRPNIDYINHWGDHMKHDWWHGRKETIEEGYLLVFRERRNEEGSREVELRFLEANAEIKPTDLRTSESEKVKLTANRQLELSIPEAADFVFLKYEAPTW